MFKVSMSVVVTICDDSKLLLLSFTLTIHIIRGFRSYRLVRAKNDRVQT